MKFLRSIIGYMFAGMLVFSFWGFGMDSSFGVFGGVLSAFVIIGFAWFLNHHLGLIHHGPNSAFVDLGLGVGMTGLFRGTFDGLLNQNVGLQNFTDALPTLAIVIIGAAIGGYVAALVEADLAKDKGGK
ncbi:MAG: hypothetical protein GXY98_06335 [Erysipelothrix sp.]|nr:hypothetical protein [Erysipelothrix sp.]